jgi:CDP-glucose 4,6-dehydratase
MYTVGVHFYITGHTGFKGTWLVALLANKGHKVSGYALNPTPKSIFEIADVTSMMENDFRGDILDLNYLESTLKKTNPDFVIHLAAQSMVLDSFNQPHATFLTNVTGTLNVLEVTNKIPSIKSQLIVTTDKVYKNNEKKIAFQETDELSGHEPYSASKAMADILTHSWSNYVTKIPTGIARAGNVIGGGDSASNRLFPDIIRTLEQNNKLILRSPHSTRPWQHVLDCLEGYYLATLYLAKTQKNSIWNFGPNQADVKSVREVLDIVEKFIGNKIECQEIQNEIYESKYLSLNSDKAQSELNWQPRLTLEQSIKWTLEWHSSIRNSIKPVDILRNQIDSFERNEIN